MPTKKKHIPFIFWMCLQVKCAVCVYFPTRTEGSVEHLWLWSTSEGQGQVSVVSLHTTKPALIESFQVRWLVVCNTVNSAYNTSSYKEQPVIRNWFLFPNFYTSSICMHYLSIWWKFCLWWEIFCIFVHDILWILGFKLFTCICTWLKSICPILSLITII